MASGDDSQDLNSQDNENTENTVVPDATPIDELPRISELAITKIPEKTEKPKTNDERKSEDKSKDIPFFKSSNKMPGFPKGIFNSSAFPNKDGIPNFMNQNALSGGNVTAIQIGYANNLHFGNNITINHGNQSKQNKPPPPANKEAPKPRKSTVPESILNSTREVTEEMMLVVKTGDIGYKWKDFGQQLNLSNGLLETVEYEHRQYGLNEIVFQLMIRWREKLGKSATVGKLAKVLVEIGRDELALEVFDCDS